jgi:alginate O-acetyltransferase complex protein AlgI
MLLGGLWHGASWNFVGWGALHGLGLVGEKYFPLRVPAFFKWLGTFSFVCLSFAFFRIQSLQTTLDFLKRVFTLEPGQPLLHPEFYVPFFFLLMVIHWSEIWRREELFALAERLSAHTFSMGYGPAVSLVLTFPNCGLRPFVYFQF